MNAHFLLPDGKRQELEILDRQQTKRSPFDAMSYTLREGAELDAWRAAFPEGGTLRYVWQDAAPGRGECLHLRTEAGITLSLLMQGVNERDYYLRAWPHPLPGTHLPAYRWEGRTITFEVVVNPDVKAAVEQATGTAPSDPAEPETDGTKALSQMSKADLLTHGVEIGAPVNKDMNKASLIAAILQHKANDPGKPASR